jgi:hypothetical protein
MNKSFYTRMGGFTRSLHRGAPLPNQSVTVDPPVSSDLDSNGPAGEHPLRDREPVTAMGELEPICNTLGSTRDPSMRSASHLRTFRVSVAEGVG